MTRYYFDIDDGDQFHRDDLGAYANSLREVRDGAIAALPEIAQQMSPDRDHRVFTIYVRDKKGHAIFKATLSFTAQWRPDQLKAQTSHATLQ
jgi:hypothetical protein